MGKHTFLECHKIASLSFLVPPFGLPGASPQHLLGEKIPEKLKFETRFPLFFNIFQKSNANRATSKVSKGCHFGTVLGYLFFCPENMLESLKNVLLGSLLFQIIC